MKGLLNAMHPSFEALSAHADLHELDAARSRVGRHIAACAQCRATIDEIRELGDAARAGSVAGAPDGLWARIEEAAKAPVEHSPRETPPPDARPWDDVPSLRPTRHWPIPARKSARYGVLVGIAAAAAIVALLVWPRGSSLQAAGTSRLTFSPGRPRAGSVVSVRYSPASWFTRAPKLVLVGRVQTPAVQANDGWSSNGMSGDSLATLRPARDGYFEGSFRIPEGVKLVEMTVTDSAGSDLDSDGWAPWSIVVAGPDGGPSFDGLLVAARSRTTVQGLPASSAPRQRFNPADSLRRYFPNHPAGFAYQQDEGKEKGVLSFLNYFRSGERKYLGFWEKLWPRESLDGETLVAMVAFANRIGEPGEARQWTQRLVREHPEHPAALMELAATLHEIELREPRGLADSIRPWLPTLDTLFRLRPQRLLGYEGVMPLVRRYGDSATVGMWTHRYDSTSRNGPHQRWYSEGELRVLPASVAAAIERSASIDCSTRGGRFPLLMTGSERLKECASARGREYSVAARWRLFNGDPRGAVALAESASAQITIYNGCSSSGPHRTAASAWLLLGDTTRAERELVAMFDIPRPEVRWMDTLRTALGRRFDEARLRRMLDSSAARLSACQLREMAERRARFEQWKARNR